MPKGQLLTSNKLQANNLQGKKQLKWKMPIKLIFTHKMKQKMRMKVNKPTTCNKNLKILSLKINAFR